MKNQFLKPKRFSVGFSTDFLLVLVAVFLIFKPRPVRPIKISSSLGGRVIFQATVTPDTWCEVVAWEGSVLYKTQQVVYCQFKNLEKYREKSLDTWGWLWYYDVGRKLTNEPWQILGNYPGVTPKGVAEKKGQYEVPE